MAGNGIIALEVDLVWYKLCHRALLKRGWPRPVLWQALPDDRERNAGGDGYSE